MSGDKQRETEILIPLVYDELRRVAARHLNRERPGQTLQPTALVNELFIRLTREQPHHFNNRTHFLAIATIGMRQILIEKARARKRMKRGGAPQRVTLDDHLAPGAGWAQPSHGQPKETDIEALDEALKKLEQIDPGLAKVVELRYFGGLTVEETADVMGSSPATVKRHFALARAWLKRALEQ